MSFSVASYFTCSPRASSASATSASSPTAGAAALLPRCFDCSSRHSTEKRIGNLDRSYSAPAVALSQVRRTDGRRRTIHSRTTPTPFSTAPGHSCMKSLAHNRTLGALPRVSPKCVSVAAQTSSSCPQPRLASSAIDSSLPSCVGCSSTDLDHSRQLLHPSLAPFNLHKSRVRRASGFLLTAFSNATPHTFFQP